jgi:hypothetical protein
MAFDDTKIDKLEGILSRSIAIELKYCPGICFEQLKKTRKYLREDTEFQTQNSN